MKINKVFGSFYDGVSQQSDEQMQDTQCRGAENVDLSIIRGTTKRPPAIFTKFYSYLMHPYLGQVKPFHSYSIKELKEGYILAGTNNLVEPLVIFNTKGEKQIIEFPNSSEEALVKEYLYGTNLQGLTAQNKTWIWNSDKIVSLDYSATSAPAPNYDKIGFYWVRGSSGDPYRPYNYAIYLDGKAIQTNSIPHGNDWSPSTRGFEDTEFVATKLAELVNAHTVTENGVAVKPFKAEALGSMVKIERIDGGSFEFKGWDSFGSRASVAWKGSVNKISDLPDDVPFKDVYVAVKGGKKDAFANYYIKMNDREKIEVADPSVNRGKFINMPILMERKSIDSNGIATFILSTIDWKTPKVGNLDNNPDPSFISSALEEKTITDLFFFKERLGLVSGDSIAMSVTKDYYNFFPKTVTAINPEDPIDIRLSVTGTSTIQALRPFSESLYIFTSDAQHELVSDSYFTADKVSIHTNSYYTMGLGVPPLTLNYSLYFLSTDGERKSLMEYNKTRDKGNQADDLSIVVPDYMNDEVTSIIGSSVNGYIFCTTKTNKIYTYKYLDDARQRVQSSWNTWEFYKGSDAYETSYNYLILDDILYILYSSPDGFHINHLKLAHKYDTRTIDIGFGNKEYPYTASILLPVLYPKLTQVKTPLNKTVLQSIAVECDGDIQVKIVDKGYKTTTRSKLLANYKGNRLKYIARLVTRVDIYLYDDTESNFKLTSVTMEGSFNPTSREVN